MIRTVRIRRRPARPPVSGDLHPVVARVLSARGLDQPPDYSLRCLLPPTLGGLQRAAALLADAVQSRSRILIAGDFDTDGATGTALAVHGLHAMGAGEVLWRVPDRFRHGYGLSAQLVADCAGLGAELLVTVDQGVSSVDGVLAARAAGMRVIVTDHHLPGDTLPAADAIVNPNLPGDPFPSKALAGVGVMFYLLAATRAVLRERGHFKSRPEPRLDTWLDLVALGTVADLVPLDDNNRCLVWQGLQRIRAGRCVPGIRALLELAGRNPRQAGAADLGFAVAPRLNAAGRLDDMSVGIRCLLAGHDSEARLLAGTLDEINRERRGIQAQMEDGARAQVEQALSRVEGNLDALCVFDEEWHQGVVGLVASRLMERLNRPVIAFAPEASGSSRLKGSGRSPPGIHMRDLLVAVEAAQPGLMERFGGHARAAGLSLQREHLPRFSRLFEQQLDGHNLGDGVVETDGELAPGELTLEAAQALDAAGPWGQQWPEPLFDSRFKVLQRRVVGRDHLRLTLCPVTGGNSVEAIAFGAGAACHGELAEPLHLTYRLEVNHWQGRMTPQLNVQHWVKGAVVD